VNFPERQHTSLGTFHGVAPVLAICGLLFLLGVTLRINGSSSSFWYFKLGQLTEGQRIDCWIAQPDTFRRMDGVDTRYSFSTKSQAANASD
jgi:hypothetical protein